MSLRILRRSIIYIISRKLNLSGRLSTTWKDKFTIF